MIADPIEEIDQLAHFAVVKAAQDLLIERLYRRIEASKEIQSGLGDAYEHLSAVLHAAFALHETLGQQPVDHERDARSLLHHPISDGQRGQALGPGAAQDAQHIVLLHGHLLLAGTGQEVDHALTNRFGGDQQAYWGFMPRIAEGPA